MIKKILFCGCLSALLSLEAQSAKFEVVSDKPDAKYAVKFRVSYESSLIKEETKDIVTLEWPNNDHSESLITKLSDLSERVHTLPAGNPLGIKIKIFAQPYPADLSRPILCKQWITNRDKFDGDLETINNQIFTVKWNHFSDRHLESCTVTPLG